ncbi:PEP-CTERM sorting domain-containing protein [Tundrisphaera lichenicola]|uniref:PEP-CTERM sorting domain-containing protein n=1 Tax=Tundrisphaera lichenicola TaxID=2029860 RepID=UPI003EC13FA3
MLFPPRALSRSCLVAFMVWMASTSASQAGLLVNGDFSSGLAGWTVTVSDSVSVIGGVAVLSESPTVSEVTLYQDFMIPVGLQTLSFELIGVGTEDDFPPSGFGASLLDPGTLASLVTTVDAFTDSFYTRDLDSSTTQGMAALGVSVSPSGDSLPVKISVDVSALGGEMARILFRLVGGGSLSESSVSVDNVYAGANFAVPEPSSLALLSVGLIGLARRYRR